MKNNISSEDAAKCPRCGAVPRDGKTCLDKYHEVLALEFEDPAYFGAVHHITVMCYNIQHPDAFSDDALDWMRKSLRAVMVDGLTPAELRKQAGKGVAGGMKVRRRGEQKSVPARTVWSMTVMDVRTDSAEIYHADIRAWAGAILKDLGMA